MARNIAQELREHGYEYLGGTSQRARNVETGETISRRQWERVLGTPLADSATPSGRRMDLYTQAQRTYAETPNTTVEMEDLRPSWRNGMSLADVRKAPEFREALRELRAYAAAERRAMHAGRPWIVYGRPQRWEQRLRRALTIIGYRRPEWTMNVGESPS